MCGVETANVNCHEICRFGPAVSFFVDNWILFFIAITSGAMLLWPLVGRGGGALSVGTAEAGRVVNRAKGGIHGGRGPAENAARPPARARHGPAGEAGGGRGEPVSYTHLTLPTRDLVEISVVAGSLKKKKKEQTMRAADAETT